MNALPACDVIDPPAEDRLSRLWRAAARALVWMLCVTTAWPAWPASTLVQAPPFTATEPPGNVFVMLDDSGSMGNHWLPLPAGITIVPGAGARVTIQGMGADTGGVWSLRSWSIDRDNDWKLRAPALNPLWYNPAVRYRPWNKDGVLQPEASIGGSLSTTNWGAHASRANAAQLTERDPRQVPTGSAYTSLTSGAGRGLIGTDLVDPTGSLNTGRRVNLASPAVDFRYYKMPFDFGPAQPGATSAPRNGHANAAWTTHNDTTSPLDLFSRPLASTPAVTRSGCFGSAALCASTAAPATPLITTTWQRTNCAGVVETFTSDPGPLTCHRARCGSSGTWTAWSTTPPALACGFAWTDCNGVAQTSPTNPGPISCSWRRQDCSGTLLTFPSSPGPLTCHRTRACDGSGYGGWTAGAAPTLPACYRRNTCSGTAQYFSGSDPGPLSCAWSRQDCNGTSQTFASNPGSLTCWQRQSCTGSSTTIFTSAPSPPTLACRYERQNCSGALQQFAVSGGDPGNLTCYTRNNCGGGTTGPTETVLSPVSCAVGGELPVVYAPTTSTRASSLVTRTATTFTRSPSGGGTQNASVHARVDTTTRNPLAPSTITPTAVSRQDATAVNGSASSSFASCPAGTSLLTCTTTPAANVPDPEALTPARYYAYTGTGDKGDPANYRVVQIDRTRPASVTYPVVDATTGLAVTSTNSMRTDCTTHDKTACTWVEEAQNFANWYLYYRNRLFAAQAVMSDAMSGMTTASQQQLRLGYGRINYFSGAIDPWRTASLSTLGTLPAVDGFANPGALVRGVRPFAIGSTARASFFDWLFSLSWVGSTPNREAIDSVGRYFSWSDQRGPWGATPGTSDAASQLACRRNYAFLATDGEWTNVSAGQPLISASGPLAAPGTPVEADNVGGPTLIGEGPNAGTSFTYAPSAWPQFTGGASQSGTLTDVATYYWNHDLRPDLPNVLRPITDSARPNPAFWQSMSTFIVGYGLSASMDTDATRAAAASGGTVNWPTLDLGNTVISGGNRVNDNLRAALASRGDFYAARDTAALRSGILNAFSEIVAQQGSAGGVAVTGAAVTGSTQAFFPSYTTGKWTGSLRAFSSADFESLAAGASVTPLWSASVPAVASRNLLTSTARTSATTFQAANLSAAQQLLLTGADYTPAEVVSYVRGDASLELPVNGSSAGRKFRRRESPLGDFVNSTPLYMKAADYGYGAMPTIGPSYASYVSARRSGSGATVFIGGNAGVFHGFDAATGLERFGYVPRGVIADLPRLTDPSYSHRYYVDGPVTGGDWHNGSAWRAVVVGTTGAGGANVSGGGSIFAIDVTDPGSVGASNVLWDITKADNQHIGHVLSRGVIGRVKTHSGTTRWVWVAGNGYESTSQRAALLVVDLATGSLTAIPVGPVWNGIDQAARNGMGGVTVAYDPQRNLSAVYAGDRQGNLWRFDFSDGVPSAAKGFGGANAPLFTAVDGTVRRPISAAPRLALHPRGGRYIVFGTGKLHDEGDAYDTSSQAIYALWEKPGHGAAITASQISAVSVSTGSGGERSFSVNTVDWSTRLGWSAPLTGGERIVSDPSAELGTLSIVSFKPGGGGDACAGGGESYLYRLNYASGTATGVAITGTVGAITPQVSLPSRQRTLSSVNLPSLMTGPGAGGGGTGGEAPASQCQLYLATIKGIPERVANACPGFSPLRAWRQPTR
jgi:type IV pilus assembly protein PilY1